MNSMRRRIAGGVLALVSGATIVGVAGPAADAAPVHPGVKHWLCNYGGESSRVWIGSGYNDGKAAPVKQAQCLLTMAGYHLMQDGKFGQATNNAVLSFQSKHHLKRDGIVGPSTWGALDKYNKQVN